MKIACPDDQALQSVMRLARDRGYQGVVSGRAALSQPSLMVKLFDMLGEWQERARERRQLMTLDSRALADVAITRAEAEAEYGKMPWHL